MLVAATRDGRLVEFGGSFPAVSSDQGRTFTEIGPLVPPTSDFDDAAPRQVGGGEGTVVMAPGGDIVGVTWDPYSGDRLQSFFYSVADKRWLYGELPLHEPFYDRESGVDGAVELQPQGRPDVDPTASATSRRATPTSSRSRAARRPGC